MFKRITQVLGIVIVCISVFLYKHEDISILSYKYTQLNKILYILLFCMYLVFMIKEIKDTYPKVKVLSIVTYLLILIGISLAII